MGPFPGLVQRGGGGGGGGAPTDADYLVKTANGSLSAERVVTDTTGNTGVTVDWGTAGQAKFLATNAGKWIKLATATASSSATVDFTGLSSTYAAYKIVFSHIAPATDNVALWLRTSSNGGSSYDSGASDYRYVSPLIGSIGTYTSNVSGGAAQIVVIDGMGNAANEVGSGEVTIYNPSAAKYGQLFFSITGTDTSSGTRVVFGGGGVRKSAADIDAIRLMYSSGDIASGIFDLYGLAN